MRILKIVLEVKNIRILDSNLNPHEEKTGKKNCIGKYKRHYKDIFICNFFFLIKKATT